MASSSQAWGMICRCKGAAKRPIGVRIRTAILDQRHARKPAESSPVKWTPPAVFPTVFLMALRRSMGGIPSGSILAKQQMELLRPLAVESEARVVTWIGEKYLRRERAFVVFEFEVRDDQDEVVLTGRKVIVWPNGPRGDLTHDN